MANGCNCACNRNEKNNTITQTMEPTEMIKKDVAIYSLVKGKTGERRKCERKKNSRMKMLLRIR